MDAKVAKLIADMAKLAGQIQSLDFPQSDAAEVIAAYHLAEKASFNLAKAIEKLGGAKAE